MLYCGRLSVLLIYTLFIYVSKPANLVRKSRVTIMLLLSIHMENTRTIHL